MDVSFLWIDLAMELSLGPKCIAAQIRWAFCPASRSNVPMGRDRKGGVNITAEMDAVDFLMSVCNLT